MSLARPPHVYFFAWYQPIPAGRFNLEPEKIGFLGFHLCGGLNPSGSLPYSWLAHGYDRLADGSSVFNGGEEPRGDDALTLWNEAKRRFLGGAAPRSPRFLVMNDAGDIIEMGKRAYFVDYWQALVSASGDLAAADCHDLIEQAAFNGQCWPELDQGVHYFASKEPTP